MIPLYHLHPIVVHFPIALLILGLVVRFISLSKKSPEWLSKASAWLLWIGTLSLWAAVGSGLLAENTAPHVPAAWEVMHHHEELGFWTAGVFSALSLVQIFLKGRFKWIVLVGWILGVGLLIETGMHGGQLVFYYGVGVSLPE